jgi:hypothetical protein
MAPMSSSLGHQTSHDVTRDGRRFLAVVDADHASGAPPPEIHVTLNWQEALKQRVPTK